MAINQIIKNERGVSNLEVLVVAGIISALVFISGPIGQVHNNYTKQKANLKQLVAHQLYVNKDSMPDLVIADGNGVKTVLYGQDDGSYKSIEQIQQETSEYLNQKR